MLYIHTDIGIMRILCERRTRSSQVCHNANAVELYVLNLIASLAESYSGTPVYGGTTLAVAILEAKDLANIEQATLHEMRPT